MAKDPVITILPSDTPIAVSDDLIAMLAEFFGPLVEEGLRNADQTTRQEGGHT